jgi:hypothetical protein
MDSLSNQIEELILQYDKRGISRLRQNLKPGYCHRAARLILKNKGVVLIGTGFPASGSFESDGPIGAIALYQILTHLGCQPIFVCAPPISTTMARGFLTYEMPISDWDQSRKFVKKAVKQLTPALIVSVERPGITVDGRYYNMYRDDITDSVAKYDLFFENDDCPSIAFGDGGNEIGMGNLKTHLSAARLIPSVTTCDELVIATVSNWGVYGVIGILNHLLNANLFDLVDPANIANYLVANGCVDGVTYRPEATEDGFSIDIGISIINQIRKCVLAH